MWQSTTCLFTAGCYFPISIILLLILPFGHVSCGTDFEINREEFITKFVAADKGFQAWCIQTLKGEQSSGGQGSQQGQDAIVFWNVFAHRHLTGWKGFYIESGANHWKTFSNSLFYDKCLGWAGLCIEPTHTFHKGHKKYRSCTLIPALITAKEQDLTFMDDGLGGTVVKSGTQAGSYGGVMQHVKTVHGMSLKAMLARVGRTHVDFWSLDVEGHELVVLGAVDWEAITFTAVLVEHYHISMRELDYILTMHGLDKRQQLPSDSLYVVREASFPRKPWYHPKNFEWWEDHIPKWAANFCKAQRNDTLPPWLDPTGEGLDAKRKGKK